MRLHRYFGLPSFALYFATSAPAISGAAGGGEGTSGAGAGSGGGAPSSTAGGAPAAPSQSAAPVINWETAPAQFREAFNTLKRSHEELQGKYTPYEKLGKVEDITRIQTQHTQAVAAARQIATGLNIPDQELQDAVNQYGLAAVLNQLRQEQWEAEEANNGNQDIIRDREFNERIEQAVQQHLSPIQERENQRVTHEANQFVERTIADLATNALKATGVDWTALPNEYKNFVLTGVTEALKYDSAGMQEVKFKGATAPLQRAFQTFTAMADAYYLARRQAEGNVRQAPQRPGAPPAAPGKRPSIDEMISNPDSIREAQGRAAYSS